MSVTLFAALSSLVIFAVIIELIRLGGRASSMRCFGWERRWSASFGLWRDGLNELAYVLGIAYSPNALFVLAMAFVLLLLLHYSTVISKLSDRTTTLTQRIAILEERLRELEGEARPRLREDISPPTGTEPKKARIPTRELSMSQREGIRGATASCALRCGARFSAGRCDDERLRLAATFRIVRTSSPARRAVCRSTAQMDPPLHSASAGPQWPEQRRRVSRRRSRRSEASTAVVRRTEATSGRSRACRRFQRRLWPDRRPGTSGRHGWPELRPVLVR